MRCETISVPPSRPSGIALRSSGGFVLIVDDDREATAVLSRLLVMDGFEVAVATDGLDAMLQIGSRMPDVVVTDVCMDGGDGRALLRAMRARFPDVPVIVMSGEPQSAGEFLRNGALAYLTKPIQLDDVVSVLDVAIQLREDRGPIEPPSRAG